MDETVEKINELKKKMEPQQMIKAAEDLKETGNNHYKNNEPMEAVDCYYQGVMFIRNLVEKPGSDAKHTNEQYKSAKSLTETLFTNIAMSQCKYVDTLQKNDKEQVEEALTFLDEAQNTASEALKLNPKNVKALYRRGVAQASLANWTQSIGEALMHCEAAKENLLAVLQEDPKNREAHTAATKVQEHMKELKKKQLEGEKLAFSFHNNYAPGGYTELREKDPSGGPRIGIKTFSGKGLMRVAGPTREGAALAAEDFLKNLNKDPKLQGGSLELTPEELNPNPNDLAY